METVKAKKYRPKSEQKIIKTDGVYFCVEDEGSGSGKCRSGFKNCSRNSVQKHQSKAHYRKKEHNERNRSSAQTKRGESSLTSYVTDKKKKGLLPIFPIQGYNSDSDWEDDVPLQFRMDRKMIDEAEKKKYAKDNAPYNGSFFCAYVPEKPDIGPNATYALRNQQLKSSVEMVSEEEKVKYTFSLYFGTSAKRKICGYLDGTFQSSGGAKLVKLMKDGHVCHRKDFTFSGGSKKVNKDDAMDWAHFYKHVKLEKDFVPKDHTKVIFDILNGGLKGGLQRKNSYERVLSDAVKEKAKKIEWQNRSLMPLPPDLLQEDPEDVPWIQHKLSVKRKRS